MSAHTFWRLNFAGADTGTTLTLAEVQLRTSVGGTNVATLPTVSSSSASTTFSGQSAASAYDGNANTGWLSDGSALPQTLRYTLASATTIVSYSITAYNGTVGSGDWNRWAPKTHTLEYSTDGGSTWTVANTVTNEGSWALGESRSYIVSSPASAVDWRINISANQTPGAGAYTGFAEFRVGAASASSGAATNAFDANNATNWALTSGTVGWLQYQFASAVDIVEHAITAPSATTTNAPNRWSLQYSDDGSNWGTAALVGGQTSWTSNEQRVFTNSSYSVSIGVGTMLPNTVHAVQQDIPAASTRATLRNDPALQTSTMLSGTVKQNGTNVSRTVRAYCRLTGEILGEAVSDGTTGAFSINARGKTGYCYVVALDDLGTAPDYNAAIFDLVLPV